MAFSHLLMATLLAVHAPALTVLLPMMLGAGTFTVGLAPLSWIIVSEIFPNRVRSPALAVVCVFLFGSSSLTVQLFPMAMDWLQASGQVRRVPSHVRSVRGDMRIVRRLLPVKRMMPETKGLTLDALGGDLETQRRGPQLAIPAGDGRDRATVEVRDKV